MNSKEFSLRFNRELSLSGFPEDVTEKTRAIVKVFKVTQHMAHSMIFGLAMPSTEQLNHIARILEVCPKWLSGMTDRKKAWSGKDLIDEEDFV